MNKEGYLLIVHINDILVVLILQNYTDEFEKISSDVSDLLNQIYTLWGRYNPNEEHLETKNEKYICEFLEENAILIRSINKKIEDLLNALRGELKVEVKTSE
ncbi:hypothetical protein ACTFO3_25800 [Bacillus cereus group sp. MYBK69-2]|uniref:hypothetical protein n=1 Tax=unclassified Bacillus cereus group TaxID=2750818 RepID=UPI003F791402